jgi:CheY-like chemotaxis protein
MSTPNPTRHALAILVVDDSCDTADSLAELLRLSGHTVATAYDGASALRSVAAAVPDVVFLDIRMPGLSGYDVVAQIRASCSGGRRPLLIAVTGGGSAEDRRRSAGAGFDLHLVKPVDPAVLLGMTDRFREFFAPTIPAADLDQTSDESPDFDPHLTWSGERHEIRT